MIEPTPGKTLVAVAVDALGFIAGVRKNLAEIEMTYATLDAIAGWADGFASKTLVVEPPDSQARDTRDGKRWFGRRSFDELLAANGLEIWLVRNEEKVEKLKEIRQFVRPKRPMRSDARHPYIVQRVTRAMMRQNGLLSVSARMAKMTPAKRRAIARRAARARWARRRAAMACGDSAGNPRGSLPDRSPPAVPSSVPAAATRRRDLRPPIE